MCQSFNPKKIFFMKKLLIIFLALVLITMSCTKSSDNLTVTLKLSGKLSATVIDNTGKGIANVKVAIYDEMSRNNLDEVKTDGNGFVNFGELNEGTYTISVDTPKVNGIKYHPYKTVQVISASTKNVVINVLEYSGTLNLTFYNESSSYPYLSYSGLNVILVSDDVISYNDMIASLIKKAEFTGKTDTDGKIAFALPSGRNFYIIAYADGNSSFDRVGNVFLSKGQTMYNSYNVYFNQYIVN